MIKTHSMQNVRRLGELNCRVINNLDAVPPWVEEVQERPCDLFDSRRLKSTPSGLLIVYDETEMPSIIGRLLAAALQGDELVAEINEGHVFAFAAQLKFE